MNLSTVPRSAVTIFDRSRRRSRSRSCGRTADDRRTAAHVFCENILQVHVTPKTFKFTLGFFSLGKITTEKVSSISSSLSQTLKNTIRTSQLGLKNKTSRKIGKMLNIYTSI